MYTAEFVGGPWDGQYRALPGDVFEPLLFVRLAIGPSVPANVDKDSPVIPFMPLTSKAHEYLYTPGDLKDSSHVNLENVTLMYRYAGIKEQ